MTLNVRSQQYRENPYAVYRELRAGAPVCRVEPYGYWAVSRYDDVIRILKDPKLFSSAGISERFIPIQGAEALVESRSLLGYDPPEHTRLRGLVNKAFTSATVQSLEPRIRGLARALIQEIRAKGPAFDLVSDFSMPLPVIVIAELLGIHPEKREDFKRWSDILISWRNARYIEHPGTREAREREIVRGTSEMMAYFAESIERKRREPGTDLVSVLVQACDSGQKLTSEEVVGLLRLLLVAGNETTTNLIGNAILAVLARPAVWQAVKADRALVPNLVEETLRFDGPVLSLLRRATEDVEIAGVSIAKNEILMPLLASANHDEARYPDPESFDLRRNTQGHVAFGAGIHFCLGAPLARLEAKVAFEELCDAFEELARTGDEPLEFVDSFALRGLSSLPLAIGSSAGFRAGGAGLNGSIGSARGAAGPDREPARSSSQSQS